MLIIQFVIWQTPADFALSENAAAQNLSITPAQTDVYTSESCRDSSGGRCRLKKKNKKKKKNFATSIELFVEKKFLPFDYKIRNDDDVYCVEELKR